MSLGDCPLFSSCTKRAMHGAAGLARRTAIEFGRMCQRDLVHRMRSVAGIKASWEAGLVEASCSQNYSSSCIVMPSTTDIYLHPWLHHHTCSLVLVSALACNGSMLRSTALVPSALATDITRSDIASFRAPSKDAEHELR
jgi:hypothetical protein